MTSPTGMQGLFAPDDITVNVRFRTSHVTYQLGRCSTVGELRQRLAADYHETLEDVKILLGGSLLDDNLTIEDSGVGMESTLFAILQQRQQQQNSSVSQATSSASSSPRITATTVTVTASIMTTASPTRSAASATTESRSPPTGVTTTSRPGVHPGSSSTQATTDLSVSAASGDCVRRHLSDQYYVYCKLCHQVRAGRLRVKCSVCEGGAVLLDTGPGSWEDVLMPGRLTGTCQTLHCRESRPIFFFKCSEQHGGSVDSTAVALHHIMPNRHCVPCITCEDVMSPVVVFPCEYSHVMCLGCFERYCSVRLSERGFHHTEQFGYTLPCPAGCLHSYIEEQHHFCVLGAELYDRYKDFAAEECLLAGGGLFCPAQHCASGFMMESPHPSVTCPTCKFEFCRHCRRDSHEGPCLPASTPTTQPQEFSDAERAQRAQWEQQSLSTIQQTTKDCPGCRSPTERTGGCMHMHCARCNEEWCWLCVKVWNRDCQGAHWFG